MVSGRQRTWWDRAIRTATATFDRRGEYPIERIFAFEEYCRRTPPSRVFLVLLLTCAPSLALLILFDLMPLRDPREGWRANSFFWLRVFICANVNVAGIMAQIQAVVLDTPLSRSKVLFIMLFVSSSLVATAILAAELWVFPIPFMITLTGLPFSIYMNIATQIAIGSRDPVVKQRITKFNNIVSVQTTMMLVYPTYHSIFLKLNRMSQVAFVGLLPIIKLSYKFVMARVSVDLGDLAPAIIASVDLFDALYTTKCMQSAGSLWVGFTLITLDMAMNCAAVLSLFKQFRELKLAHARLVRERNSSAGLSTERRGTGIGKLLPLIPKLASEKHLFRSATSVQIPSHNKLKMSAEGQAKVNSLLALQQQATAAIATTAILPTPVTATGKKPSIRTVVPLLPHPPVTQGEAQSTTVAWQKMTTPDPPRVETSSTRVIKDAARLLHQSESVVLVEYIEAAVPMFYSIYVAILYHLPNAKYYQDMDRFDTTQLNHMALSILLYACLELVSLVLVNEALKRTFGVSVTYQLAFTLENEWHIYQSNFVSWVLIIFQFLLVHNGADFTFEFTWIK